MQRVDDSDEVEYLKGLLRFLGLPVFIVVSHIVDSHT